MTFLIKVYLTLLFHHLFLCVGNLLENNFFICRKGNSLIEDALKTETGLMVVFEEASPSMNKVE